MLENETVKYVVAIGFAVGLFALAKFLSRGTDSGSFAPPLSSGSDDYHTPDVRKTGRDIPFPFDMSELESVYGSDYQRPEVVNYYFDQTDLSSGPADPISFVDNFHLVIRFPGIERVDFPCDYVVATPAGLDRRLKEEPENHLAFLNCIVISRYDLRTIVRAVMLDVCGPNEPDAVEQLPLPGE